MDQCTSTLHLIQPPICISISSHLAPLHRQSQRHRHTQAHIQHWIVGGGNCRWRCTPPECAVSSGCDLRILFFFLAQLVHYFHWLQDVTALFKTISAGPGQILCRRYRLLSMPLRKSPQSVPLNWRPTFSNTGLFQKCFLQIQAATPAQDTCSSIAGNMCWMEFDSSSC